MEENRKLKPTKQAYGTTRINHLGYMLVVIALLGAANSQSDLTVSPTTRAMNFINNWIIPPDSGIGTYSSDLVIMANVHGQDAIIAVRMNSGDREAVSSAEDSGATKASAR